MTSQQLKKLKIPDKSGVYFFMSGRKILYIGKATSLRDRTKSYFSKDLIETRGPLILEMVFKADGLKWQETDSVLEALILEANLIKKHQPYYNTKEKDDKSWNCVVITNEKLPRVLIVRQKEISTEKLPAPSFLLPASKKLEAKSTKLKAVFGPYTSGSQLREAMKIIRRIFPFIDEHSAKKGQREFYRQIGLTPESRKEYARNIRHIKLFFEGRKRQLLSALRKEMMSAAKERDFERAGEIKKQIFSLNHINDVALLNKDSLEASRQSLVADFRIEAYDVAHTSGQNMVGVMTVVEEAELAKNEYRKFKIKTVSGANDPASLREIITRRLGHAEWPLPNLIVVDGNDIQKRAAEDEIKKRGFNIPVVAVVKDERHRPRALLGARGTIMFHKSAILLANAESHRFAIRFHKQKRGKSFLNK